MATIIQPPLPKFDTTSLNADLANKIKAPELQEIPDGSGNLRSMIKDQSMQLGTNIEGTLDQFGENIEAEAERKAAELEAAAKQIEAAALAAAKMIEEELKRKKEEAKEAFQKALTAKEQAEDMIAKLRGFKIPRLKKLKPIPTKDLPAPPQYAKYMDADAKREYAENAKSSATKGEPPIV
jgi:hypothetical protein